MRYSASVKLETIQLVDQSSLLRDGQRNDGVPGHTILHNSDAACEAVFVSQPLDEPH